MDPVLSVEIFCDAAQRVSSLDRNCEALPSCVRRLVKVAKSLKLEPPQYEVHRFQYGFEAVVSWNQRRFRCTAQAQESTVARQKAALALLEVLHAVIGTNLKEMGEGIVPRNNTPRNEGHGSQQWKPDHVRRDDIGLRRMRRMSKSPQRHPSYREHERRQNEPVIHRSHENRHHGEQSGRERNGRWDNHDQYSTPKNSFGDAENENNFKESGTRRRYREYSLSPSTRRARNRGRGSRDIGQPRRRAHDRCFFSKSPAQHKPYTKHAMPKNKARSPTFQYDSENIQKNNSPAVSRSRSVGPKRATPANEDGIESHIGQKSEMQQKQPVGKFKHGVSLSPKALSRTNKHAPHTCRCRICGKIWKFGSRASPSRNQSSGKAAKNRQRSSNTKALTPTKRPSSPFSNAAPSAKKGSPIVKKSSKKKGNGQTRGAWEFRGQLPSGFQSVANTFPGFRRALVKQEDENLKPKSEPKEEPKLEPKLEEHVEPVEHTGWSLCYYPMQTSISYDENSTTSVLPSRQNEKIDDGPADVMDVKQIETGSSPQSVCPN